MKNRLAMIGSVPLLIALASGTNWAGENESAAIALTPTAAGGDTLAYRVVVSGAVETKVAHLVLAYDGAIVDFVSWENGDFLENVFQIGPRLDEPPGTVLVALGVETASVDASGDIGVVRFMRRSPGDAQVAILEAALVDASYEEDWIVENDGQVEYARPVDERVPAKFAFRGVSPNPMIWKTAVSFDVPRPGAHVKIKIYDVTGRETRVLVDQHKSPGYYAEVWDLTNDHGHRVAPGIYFCRMEAAEFKDTKKVILLR